MLPAGIALLSPHLDDAVLSCWHVLTGPGEVAVVNVFAGVPPAGAPAGGGGRPGGAGGGGGGGGGGEGGGGWVWGARGGEARAPLARAGREPVNLDFLDRQYRP